MLENDGSQLDLGNDTLSSQSSPELVNSNHILYSHNQHFTDETFQDSDDCYEFGFNYEQVQEYDVREKIQTLNAQLACEPLPPEPEYRNSKVGFKDEIVSLVAPPDYYYPSESELDDTSYNNDNPEIPASEDKSTVALAPEICMTPQPSPEVINEKKVPEVEVKERNNFDSTEDDKTVPVESDKSKKAMVVSRGGDFQFLSSDEITDGSKRISKRGDANETKVKHIDKRPISAPATRRNRDHGLNVDSGSFMYSDPNLRSSSTLGKPNDASKSQIPRVDKDVLYRQQQRKKKEEEENKKRDGEKENIRKEENEKSFNTWLQIKQKRKKEEEDRKKIEEEEEIERKEKKQEERKLLAAEIETELSKKMALEKRKEEKLRQYKSKEIEDSMVVHTDSECRKAFKGWLKKKQDEHQMKIREERQNARITRLAMRQCRKSQNLAQAIQQSSSFRYLDFCEYP